MKKHPELPFCSVIVPAYNEARTIREVLRRLHEVPFAKEVVIVDDGSRDGTAGIAEAAANELRMDFRLYRNPVNLGKGAAVRIGYALARGEILAIQDADLELDPRELLGLLECFQDPTVRAVYGSRFADRARECSGTQWLANKSLTALTRFLYGSELTDMETCYKLFRRDVLEALRLEATGFEFEPEVTAKVLRLGVCIHERAVRFSPRSREQGKKIGWRDGVAAVATLLRWRLEPLSRIRTNGAPRTPSAPSPRASTPTGRSQSVRTGHPPL